MPRGKARFTVTAIKRAVKAAQDGGLDLDRVEIAPDGTIRLINRREAALDNPDDTSQPEPKRFAG